MGISVPCSCREVLGFCAAFIVLLAVAIWISFKDKRDWKKVFSAILLTSAIVPLLRGGRGYFLLASILLFVMSIILIFIVEHQNKGAPEPEEKGRSAIDRLLDFIRLFLSRFFVGEMLTSLYGLFLFVLFAMTLTAWLPDAIQSSQPWFALATTLYVLDIILLSAWVYGPLRRKKPEKLPETKYLVYALSSPVNPRGDEVWGSVKNASCEDLRKDRVRVNIVPLYVSIYNHFPSLERIFLLYSDVHKSEKNATKNGLKAFFEKASECLEKEYKQCVSFKVHWGEIFPSEDTETIPSQDD